MVPLLVLAVTTAALVGACASDKVVADGDSSTGTATDEGSCIPGEPDCECNGGLCLAGLECIDNVCVMPECIPGALGCECNGGLCLADLECVEGICMEPGGDGDGDPGDGDGDPGDGDGDPGDGDGDPGDGDGDPGDGDGDGDGEPDPCGNGNIDLGEACDDGNNENGDGCNNDCTASGALLWQDVIALFNSDDYGHGVAVDSSDRIFVSGSTRVLNNNVDAWYRKYSPDGQVYWTQTYDGPAPDNYSLDGCYRIAVDPDDDVLVACWSYDITFDAMLRKFDQNGAEIWTRTFDILGDDQLFGVAAAADGSIVVSGQSSGSNAFVRRYDTDGNELWTRVFNMTQRARDIGYTANGDIAVVYDPGRYARLYTTAGDVVWTYEQNTGEGLGLAIDGDEVLLAGSLAANPTMGWFGRLAANGGLSWERSWVGGGNMYAYSQDIAVDSTGRIIVVGGHNTLNQGTVATTRKYSADGQTLIWEQTLPGQNNGSAGAVSVTVDSQDNIIVVGFLQGNGAFDAYVAKYGP